jgi:glycosyltransferase involved in cell wall biosynthesis
MRVALLSHGAQQGDAIGNNVAEKVAFFHQRAAEVRVFVESAQRLHPGVASCCQVVPSAQPKGECWRYLRSADIVSFEFGHYYDLLAFLPLLAGQRPRVLLDYHGITPPDLWGAHNREALIQGLAQRGLAWCAHATFTHSAFTQDELTSRTGLQRQRLPRLGYVVDTELFTPAPAAVDWRRSLGLTDARVLLFVGRLAPNKRPALLVDALAKLGDVTPPVHAVLVGDHSDLYQAEAQHCRERARQLGVAERLHLIGPRVGKALSECYRGGDVLVLPSLWESFCIPVVEAMAAGLPVLAARATALPETVGSAGLTFTPDDPADLARQIRRVFAEPVTLVPTRPRIAVVACRWGRDIVSGAEISLRRMALALQRAGCAVSVFTTCTSDETGITSDLPPGSATEETLPVQRFAVDPVGASAATAELPAHPIHSEALLQELGRRAADFDLVLTGPYLGGLTADVARRWPEKTVVVPCFHDEPLARHPVWQEMYSRVAGLLYHSAEEQAFAEGALGINHPGSAVVGTHIDTASPGDPARGRATAGAASYVLYCGRYSSEKGLPLLVEYARRLAADHPEQVRFVFTGRGSVAVPREPWAVDLGVVSNAVKRDLLAGAAALVQLSSHESLSLAALEAWAQGTPVIAARRCSVLAGHIERGAGGVLIDTYEEFAAAVDRMLRPQQRDALGAQGRDYVCRHFGSADAFAERLLQALRQLGQPLAERMRQRGLERAGHFDRNQWRQRFGTVVENVLHCDPPEVRHDLHIQPRTPRLQAAAGAGSILVGVRVVNRGTQAALPQGPGQTVLTATVRDAQGRQVAAHKPGAPLPALLMPGRALSAVVLVPLPPAPGTYEIQLVAQRADRPDQPCGPPATVPLVIGADPGLSAADGCLTALDEAQAALVEVTALQKLPDDYRDVTQGALAGLKLRLKRKLLGNFKKAYVDVLSRQQSACNQHLLAAVQTLTECCTTLDHAVRQLQTRVAELEGERRPRAASPELVKTP